jgi:hypothetical protein
MDISLFYNSEDLTTQKDPVIFKSTFLLSWFDIILDGKMTAIQRSLIDSCIRQVYVHFLQNPTPENVPILEDMHNAMLKHESVTVK